MREKRLKISVHSNFRCLCDASLWDDCFQQSVGIVGRVGSGERLEGLQELEETDNSQFSFLNF